MQVVHVSEGEGRLSVEANYVLILILAVGLLYFVTLATSFFVRKRLYTREFMDKFNEEHLTNFPEAGEAPGLGYPDTGNGRFSAKLPYADWIDMNNG